jgi:hypothetical protein
MAEPFAAEGLEFGCWLHLKQNWGAVNQASRPGTDYPRGGRGGKGGKANCYDYGEGAKPQGFALAGQPSRQSPHECFTFWELHFNSVALRVAINPGMRIWALGLSIWLSCGLGLAQTSANPLHADRVVVLKKERTLQLLSQ